MTDEQIIRDKMNALGNIFKNPNEELFNTLFTADCDYITFMGEHLKGIKENLRVHTALANNWLFNGAELFAEINQIKFPAENVAIVIATGAIKFRWQKKVNKKRLSINTNVFVKQNGDWKIASFQNNRIKAPNLIQRLMMGK
jgi:uncharacterized protein (TIGR02246 family)